MNSKLRETLLLVAFLCFASLGSQAADVAVNATLSRSATEAGTPVQLQIKVTGTTQLGNPPAVQVSGLDIAFAGQQQSTSMQFGFGGNRSEQALTLLYVVTPEKAGTFTIPSLDVEADGRIYKTQPVTLKVQPNGSGEGDAPSAMGFAEIVIPKKTAYLGEVIPLELRLYVDSRVRWQPVAMPELTGEGFTKQKMPEPKQTTIVERDGKEYDLLVFKTAITPGKAGKISIGPGEIVYQAQVPRARRSAPRSPFDIFGDDLFNDPMFAVRQQFKAKAEPVEMTVKPLPVAGRPADFSGAVGVFDFTAEGHPQQVKIGDPVTMSLRIKGEGSFDRMTAPVLTDASGWRTYPPSSSFEGRDELSVSGTKTFEMAVIPETKKTAMPVFGFSFFDPIREKYVSLTSDAAPLRVEGDMPPAQRTPAPTAANTIKPSATPTPTPANAGGTDILGLRYERGPLRKSFEPVYLRRGFWLAQLVPLLALLGVAAMKLRRAPDAGVRRAGALRKESAALFSRLQSGQLSCAEFIEAAVRSLQIEGALRGTDGEVSSVGAAAVCAAAKSDDDETRAVEQLFEAHAEMLYAGGSAGDEALSEAERRRVLAVLEKLRRHHAKA